MKIFNKAQPMIYIHIQNTIAEMKEDKSQIIEGKDQPIRPVEV